MARSLSVPPGRLLCRCDDVEAPSDEVVFGLWKGSAPEQSASGQRDGTRSMRTRVQR